MCPYLFEIGSFKLGTYGLMMALGFLVNGWLLARELRRRDMSPDLAWEIVLGGAVGGVLGARLLAVFEAAWDHAERGVAVDWGELIFSQGGLTWYGGFAGGALGVIVVLLWRRVRVITIADAASPLLLLGYGFGRGGCQLSGDGCYGVPTDLPWAMGYPDGIVPTPPGVHVHPTPIYEILYSVAGFALLWFWLRHKRLPEGGMFAIYLVFSGIARFLVEFIRVNERYWPSFEGGLHIERTPWFEGLDATGFHGFSLSQWVGIALFLWGAVWCVRLLLRRGGAPGAPASGGGGAQRPTEGAA